MTQTQMILSDMKRGYRVSNFTAFQRHSITRLGDVIFRLRGKGYEIATINMEKDGKRWAEYRLISEPES